VRKGGVSGKGRDWGGYEERVDGWLWVGVRGARVGKREGEGGG